MDNLHYGMIVNIKRGGRHSILQAMLADDGVPVHGGGRRYSALFLVVNSLNVICTAMR